MSRFNELLHGDLETVSDIVESDNPPKDLAEIRAALANILRHLIRLEEAWDNEHEYYSDRYSPL